MTINKRVLNVSLPTLNLLGNARLLFRVVICRSAMFSVPLPRFPSRSLCFGLERRSNRTQASIRGSYGNRGCAAREICDDDASGGPVSLAREKPGKERGGAPQHPPVRRALKRRGQRFDDKQAGAGGELADFESAWQ